MKLTQEEREKYRKDFVAYTEKFSVSPWTAPDFFFDLIDTILEERVEEIRREIDKAFEETNRGDEILYDTLMGKLPSLNK
jgi:hypothetical protein